MHNHPSPFSSLSKQELEMILADQLYRNATAHANASTNALAAFTKISTTGPNENKDVNVASNKNHKPELEKTELCDLPVCHRAQCWYAHKLEELRPRTDRPANYKTKLCNSFYKTGKCDYGKRCNYIHPGQDPEQVVLSSFPMEFLLEFQKALDLNRKQSGKKIPFVTANFDSPMKQPQAHAQSLIQRSNSFPTKKDVPASPARKSFESLTFGLSSSPGSSSIGSFTTRRTDSSVNLADQLSLFSSSSPSRESIKSDNNAKALDFRGDLQFPFPPYRSITNAAEEAKSSPQKSQQPFPFFNLNEPSSFGYVSDKDDFASTVDSFSPFDQHLANMSLSSQPGSSKCEANGKSLHRLNTNTDKILLSDSCATLKSPTYELIDYPFKKFKYGN